MPKRIPCLFCAAVLCALCVSSASAEIVARAWGRSVIEIPMDPWESQWGDCGGSSVSDIYSPAYNWDGEELYELHGENGFRLDTHVDEPDVANMAEGWSEVKRREDPTGPELAVMLTDGTAELSGPNYYLTDFALASYRGSAEGFFTAGRTGTYWVHMGGMWQADLRHAYPYEPGMPADQVPEVQVIMRVALRDSDGTNLFQPTQGWSTTADGWLEMESFSQAVGYHDTGHNVILNWPCQLVEGEEYLAAVELVLAVQSPGGFVPEPGTLSLLAIGGLAIIKRRRTC